LPRFFEDFNKKYLTKDRYKYIIKTNQNDWEENNMWQFILGAIIGGGVGVMTMALIFVCKGVK
jgi:H+/Cl- antiporter ClcA